MQSSTRVGRRRPLIEWSFANELTYSDPKADNQLIHYRCVDPNIFSNSHSRSLLSESMSVFKSLQRLSTKCDALSKNELIKGSRRYRSVIHSCFYKLVNNLDKSDTNDKTLALSHMLSQMEIVWNLCEILFIDIQSNGYLLNQLLVWSKWHFTENNEMTARVTSCEMPNIDPNYWDVVISFLLKGDTENAILLLDLHSDKQRQEFTALRDLIQKMPIISNNYLLHEFYLRWQTWKEDCDQKLTDGIFDGNIKLKLIARLLYGYDDAFKQVLHLFESWYHLMVSYMLLTDPCIKEKSLADYCHICIDLYTFKRQNNVDNSLDLLITAALSYDLMQMIQESTCCWDDNWWFATHLVDLLYNANQLPLHSVEYPTKFREFFVIEYANSLMSYNNLWTFGIDYLSHCLENGLQYIDINLQRIAITEESSAHKVIHFANKLGLDFITKSVCKVLSRKWLSRNRLGSALFWALRSEDPALTNHIADKFLDHYNKTREFPDEDVLSNSGKFMVISDRMTFLAKYYEFHQFLKDSQLESAAQLLITLLVSNIAPKFFISRLLLDSLPLLETQDIVFNSEQTSQLLASLEDMLSFGENCKEDDSNIQLLQQRQDILRLAIARNLARTFIYGQ
ncbi:nuclear pore complex protein Nup85-like [Oppia nitens]|uniref:nuclear pore complex protein Nup85-like n=1 Tax=Oppia nitens TaxID=1686743 RepID=UPI0023DA1A0C|nr:nuclear pore complex protein Nup85-like [Oppia nitens]XP_054153100.1 nuclear pore complex protein Nup85-like [Oppia nitens]